MDTHQWNCRIRSARQKKRIVKTDRDKQLIQLQKRREELYQQQMSLPMVPLAQPYQRGWKRLFVLRDDVKRSASAQFYEALLPKINTIQFHYDKTFKKKKRRKKRYGYEIKQQLLRDFSTHSWEVNRMGLTDEEKTCFTQIEIFDIKTKCSEIRYVLTEPWRYVLKIAPHMVTHVKMKDLDLERELGYIETHIDVNYLGPRINLLSYGRSYRWKNRFVERTKYHNRFKKLSKYAGKEAYLALEG